ncbi:hypothetical protein P43SY_005474 [Pythium insidiosum]|uniref:Uncharacterized protein n=1 Tax=Pythium insidiosum TaxID=114742 RepID=A0AAD5Q6B7_PYTIN|nr:hypothetical protein P43SY_005474 [Pythium insidiosum]
MVQPRSSAPLTAAEYVSGDTRGAHLKLAQRHHQIIAQSFRGRCRVEPERPHPGVVGHLGVSFTTTGTLPIESRITCELPDHGWGIPSTERINAVLHLPRGISASTLKTTWNPTTRTLEFTLADAAIPADTAAVILIAGVTTPEAATAAAEATLTSFEKLVVRDTVPPSVRGGQIIDGPTVATVVKIVPGELGGTKRWQPFNCWPGAVSDATLRFTTHGRIPARGRISIELPPEGWDMPDSPAVFLRTSSVQNVRLDAVWRRDQHTLELSIGRQTLQAGELVVLSMQAVKNPDKETLISADSPTSARVTTLTASGGVIDGPTRIEVARISEIREQDFDVAKAAFDQLDTEKAGSLSADLVPQLLCHTGIVLSTERYDELVIPRLQDALHGEPVDGSSSSSPQTISKPAFLSLFAQIYMPAYKYGQQLRLAAGRGDLDTIRDLLSRGCDPNAKDGSGWSAIHYAADFGQLGALETIIGTITELRSKSSNPSFPPELDCNLRDGCGWTPLMCAAANGHVDIIAKLLPNGADANAASAEGRTALHWAATRGMVHSVELLLDHGASTDAIDRVGWTPLHCAAMHGNHDAEHALVARGANADLRDQLRFTAAQFNAIKPVELLVGR